MSTKRRIINLKVRNHPGVMCHITGLFARRVFNLEGILCAPLAMDESISRIQLFVQENRRLEQLVRQLRKLYDVLELSISEDINDGIILDLKKWFG